MSVAPAADVPVPILPLAVYDKPQDLPLVQLSAGTKTQVRLPRSTLPNIPDIVMVSYAVSFDGGQTYPISGTAGTRGGPMINPMTHQDETHLIIEPNPKWIGATHMKLTVIPSIPLTLSMDVIQTNVIAVP